MCTLFISVDSHPHYPLIIAGNRDEFYQRKTAPLQDWGDIVGGKDLTQGGHWLAANKQGCWAALTNYRDPAYQVANAHTRGDLVKEYLQQSLSIEDYVASIESGGRRYEGFNLLLGDVEGRVAHYSNISQRLTWCGAGVYGLSNALLDEPWPKVTRGKQAFSALLASGDLEGSAVLSLLHNSKPAQKAELPSTGLSVAMELLLSSLFVSSPAYGTRSSAILTRSHDGRMNFVEQGYGVLGKQLELNEFSWQL